jgi:spore coat protein H
MFAVLLACSSGQLAPIPNEPEGTPDPAPVVEPVPTAPEPAPLCQPVLAFDPVRPTEGDAVTATVVCANGRDPAALAIAFSGDLPWVAAGVAASVTTDLDDAGTRMLAVEVTDGATVEVGAGAISIADRWSAPNNIPVDPALYESEWGIPVLHLAPGAAVTESYVPMEAWFEGTAYTGQIKIRGAASAGYPKPSYTLEFEPEQLHLDGAPDKDHLVLISNFDDQSHLRQRLVFDTWAAMGDFWGETRIAPRPWPVVVYLDGAYWGLYLAVDHVDDELMEEVGLDPAGNLYKSVTHDANFYLWNAAGSPKAPLSLGWEKKEGEPPADFSDLDALTTWVATSSDATFAAELDAWLPRGEFMDWFLLVHTLAADDSAGKNAYLYHGDGQYRYAPWDFNHSVGQSWTTDRVLPTVYNDFAWNNGIFAHFHSEPALSAELWGRYDAMDADGGPLALADQLARVDAWSAETIDSADRDWDRWEADYRAYWSWRDDIWDPAGETAYVRQWLIDRDAYLATVH